MKVIFFAFVVLLLVTQTTFAQTQIVDTNTGERVINYGMGLGGTIAVVASWSRNRSILFAILHGILGWFYVIYYLVTRKNEDPE